MHAVRKKIVSHRLFLQISCNKIWQSAYELVYPGKKIHLANTNNSDDTGRIDNSRDTRRIRTILMTLGGYEQF